MLEVGSGTGAILSEVKKKHAYNILGIDIDRPSLEFSKEIILSPRLVQGDGYQLPFAAHIFSATFSHYLLLWLQRPGKMLNEMQRVTKTGGAVIALAEPDHQSRIDFPPPLDHLGALQAQALKDQGVDITIGRRLGKLFYECGFENIETGVLGAQWTEGISNENDETEWMALLSDLSGQLSHEKLAHYKSIDDQSRRAGTRILFIPTFYAIGFVK